jgi:excisionase family DNA binding protein
MQNDKGEKGSRMRPTMRDYVGTREAAQMLGVHRTWVERLCRGGKIEASQPLREWRIKRSVIEAMLERKGGDE